MPKLVHLYPTGDAFVHGWPTTELDVEPEQAAELLAYHPPVYSTEPTGWPPTPAGGPVAAGDPEAGTWVGEAGPELAIAGEGGPETITTTGEPPAPAEPEPTPTPAPEA